MTAQLDEKEFWFPALGGQNAFSNSLLLLSIFSFIHFELYRNPESIRVPSGDGRLLLAYLAMLTATVRTSLRPPSSRSPGAAVVTLGLRT